MCGILGYVSWRDSLPEIDQLCRATNLLKHRGPDGGGYWCEGSVFLGHRRLAVIDLESGQQPMVSADGGKVISYNGEVYNYIELRDELRARGHTFRTNSDTEVVLVGYQEWGPEVASRIVGMFAVAIYDRFEQTVYLARDRFGEKPLLVAGGSHELVFASELAPIAAILPGTLIIGGLLSRRRKIFSCNYPLVDRFRSLTSSLSIKIRGCLYQDVRNVPALIS